MNLHSQRRDAECAEEAQRRHFVRGRSFGVTFLKEWITCLLDSDATCNLTTEPWNAQRRNLMKDKR